MEGAASSCLPNVREARSLGFNNAQQCARLASRHIRNWLWRALSSQLVRGQLANADESLSRRAMREN